MVPGDVAALIDARRRMTYRFCSMSPRKQVQIVAAVDLLNDETDDPWRSHGELIDVLIRRATEKGVLDRLAREINDRYEPTQAGRWGGIAEALGRRLSPAPGSIADRVVAVVRSFDLPGRVRAVDATLREILSLDADDLAAIAYALEYIAHGDPDEPADPGSLSGDFSGPDERE